MCKAVFATWTVPELPADLGEFHISCGVRDDQWDGYFHDSPSAQLHICACIEGFDVMLYAPANGLGEGRNNDYWLSPNAINGTIEAKEFGFCDADL